MMPMLCATMSCSSRAIRSRSAITVWAAAWTRSSSVRACACRIEFPMSQAMSMTRGTAIVTEGTGPPELPFGGKEFGDGSSRIRIGRPAPAIATPLPRVRGDLVRGRNAGHWRISRLLWTRMDDWLGGPVVRSGVRDGYARLVAAYLRAFGPVTERTWCGGSARPKARCARRWRT